MNLYYNNSIQDNPGKQKFVKIEFEFSSRDLSGFWNPDQERSYRSSGKLVKLSQYPSCFSRNLRRTITIVIIRNGFPLTPINVNFLFVDIFCSTCLFQRILLFCFFLFSVVAKFQGRDVSLFWNELLKF